MDPAYLARIAVDLPLGTTVGFLDEADLGAALGAALGDAFAGVLPAGVEAPPRVALVARAEVVATPTPVRSRARNLLTEDD